MSTGANAAILKMRLIDASSLPHSVLHMAGGLPVEAVTQSAIDSAPDVLCRTCRHLGVSGDGVSHWYICSRRGCPAWEQAVDAERFGCVCWEVTK